MEWNNSSDEQDKTRKKWQIHVFLICLLIAVFIWLQIKLSQEYEYKVNLTLACSNVPPGKVFTGFSDSVLTVVLRSNGYHLLLNKIKRGNKNLRLDLSSVPLKKNGNYFEGDIPAKMLESIVVSQIITKEKLVAIQPSGIYFRCEKAFNKKVPVKLNLKMSFQPQFDLLDEIDVHPDSIVIYGPPNKVAAIKELPTEPKIIKDINSSLTFSLAVSKEGIGDSITLENENVWVFVPVAKYEMAELSVPVFPDTIIRNCTFSTHPVKVKLTFLVLSGVKSELNETMFKAVFDARTACKNKKGKIKVTLKNTPAHVKVKDISPDFVEYTLIR